MLAETKVNLAEYDGVWFARSIAQYAASYEGGKKPRCVISIDAAKFGDRLPDQFTPDDIGIDVGTNVGTFGTATQPGGIRLWDGQRPIASDEFHKLERAGKLKRGPRFTRGAEQASARAAARGADDLGHSRENKLIAAIREHEFGSWKSFVRTFSDENRLTAAQRRSANGIFDDCVSRAEEHLARDRTEFDELATEIDIVNSPHFKDDSGERYGVVMRRREALMKPINEIFDKQLRPRLQGLLTTEQKDRPSEQPGK